MPERLVTPETPTTVRTTPPERSSRGRWLIFIVILILVAAAAYYFHERGGASTATQRPGGRGGMGDRPVPATTAPAQRGDMGVYVEALGTVTPVQTVTVTSRVQGQITAVHYREGQMVRQGDPLIDIDPLPYRAALTQAEGQLARDKALLEGAEINVKRYQAALSRNAIAQQTVADQEQLVRQYQGAVKVDEGLVQAAQVNLAYCHITSPLNGRVGLRLVDTGNIVQANSTTPLVVVTQLTPITVIFSVAEDYLSQIQAQTRSGRKLGVDALDRTQEKVIAHGTLSSVDNQIDLSTGTVKLRAEFTNKEGVLFPNQFVNAKLLVDTVHAATLIPNQAIQRSSQGPFVYVVGSDGVAKVRNIKTGASDGDNTAAEGVQPGETIVTAGFDKLQDGSKVAVGQQRGPANSQPGTRDPGGPGSTTNPAPPKSGRSGAPGGQNGGRPAQ